MDKSPTVDASGPDRPDAGTVSAAPTPAGPAARGPWWARALRTLVLSAGILALLGYAGCWFIERNWKHTFDVVPGEGVSLRGVEVDLSGRGGLPAGSVPAASGDAVKPSGPDAKSATKSAGATTATGFAEGAHWPGWRGRDGMGTSAATGLPDRPDPKAGLVFRVEVPGIGHSSPVVLADRVILTSSFEGGARRRVLALSTADGRELWHADVADPSPGPVHNKHGHASSTPASDGRIVVAFLGNAGLHAFSAADGKPLWNVPLGGFTGIWGTASSPMIDPAGGRVALCVDDDAGCFIGVWNLADGRPLWRTPREQERSFSSPVWVPLPDGRRELVVNGTGRVWAYDPDDGRPLWVCNGQTQWVTPTVVAEGGVVYACSGRLGPTVAIAAGGRGDVTAAAKWKLDKGSPYIPSQVLAGGGLWSMSDSGVLTVLSPADGAVLFRKRVGGNYTASPVAADGKVFFVSEEGDLHVFPAGRTWAEPVTVKLGERALASPAVSPGRLWVRTDTALYCFGK